MARAKVEQHPATGATLVVMVGDDADNGDRHRHRANDLYAVAFLRDQRECGQGPNEGQQHFINAGEWRMAGFVPAVRHCSSVGQESGPGRERSELGVGLSPGDAKAQI
jgi:hypothetical protein